MTGAPYRILSIDGGGPLSVVSLGLLRRLEEARPGFLESVDMFAGTSAGAMAALMLAAEDEPARAIEPAMEIWAGNTASMAGFLRLMSGTGPMNDGKGLEKALRRHFEARAREMGKQGPLRLRDLVKHVVIPTFNLRGRRWGPNVDPDNENPPCWKPKVFHNFHADDEDMGQAVVEVALRSSSPPIFAPIRDGYIDGGIYANNPSMCALAQAVARPSDERRGTSVSGEGIAAEQFVPKPLSVEGNVYMLSVGTLTEMSFDPPPRNWGWQRWMFDREHPMALMEAVFAADSLAVDYQCLSLLGKHRYFRLEGMMKRISNRHLVHRGHMEYLRQSADDTNLEHVLHFLDNESRWCEQTHDPATDGRNPISP